ncbi:metallophosphoesterase [Variovorax sp. Sphag1AA]|uniref:metallophosphoesterase n=1 Tax=Variovorax sp. Sphag1AA TaxID=2587027 RepID=UPI00160AE442|nr:metallophosphoesterase [Variovorax sp. Sphag1AA]MBB3182276.1 putative phosphodiesterase [Variovorax sp. Sphag1AA]
MTACGISRDDATAIRVQVVSDLHLELLASRVPAAWHGIPLVREADLLVLAGDIGRPEDVIRLFGEWPTPVLFVLGNHEFYNVEMIATRKRVRDMSQGTSIVLLDNDQVGLAEFSRFERWAEPRLQKLAGLRILGGTLWTNYDYPSGAQDWRTLLMGEAGRRLNDHRLIGYGDGLFRPEHALAQHRATVSWLGEVLEAPFDGKTLVITHHAPSAGSIHPRHRTHLLSAAFASDLPEELIGRVDLWLHGHVHDSCDYRTHGCRIVANPRGHLRAVGATDDPRALAFENGSFDAGLLVTV